MPWKVGSSDVVSGRRPRRAGEYGGLRKMAEVDWGCDGSMDRLETAGKGLRAPWKTTHSLEEARGSVEAEGRLGGRVEVEE